MSVLVIAEHDETTIRPATRHTVAAACKLDADVHLL
ncbi:MAG: electron transfer flavoprotein subunit alpha/FixB family protein, partial [Alphaproteobacteria bacterium]